MAMQIAAIAVGAGGAAMAFAAEASADAAPPHASSTGVAAEGSDASERLHVNGWSCWGAPISRGPLAPPPESDDFAELLEEVPA